MAKSAEEIQAEEKAQKEHREKLAAEANKKRNDQLLEARNAIADSADRTKEEEDELVELTDEVWDQQDRSAPKKTRAQLIEEQEEEEGTDEEKEARAAAKLIAEGEAEDRAQDEARDAGAEDIRKTDDGVTEYQVKGKWYTLGALRAAVAGGENLHEEPSGGKRAAPQAPSPEQLQAQREAREKQEAEAKAYKARLKELYTKASMGDEGAIDELAEIQTGLSRVTPDVLRIVDERVDARVKGRSEFEKAVEWFEGEYKPELSTPRLKAYAARLDRDLANQDPSLSPRERLQKVGDELRGIRTDLGVKSTSQPSKLDRKRSVPQGPQAAGRMRSEAEADEQESTSDSIQRMARERGQARAIKH